MFLTIEAFIRNEPPIHILSKVTNLFLLHYPEQGTNLCFWQKKSSNNICRGGSVGWFLLCRNHLVLIGTNDLKKDLYQKCNVILTFHVESNPSDH